MIFLQREFLVFNKSDFVVILQAPKVTGFRTMTKADVPLAFRLVTEVCRACLMVSSLYMTFRILVWYFNNNNNKSMLSLLHQLSTWRYPHLLLSADSCSTAPTSVDWYLLPAGCSAAKLLASVASVDQVDRQMDTQLWHRPCSTYYAGSIKTQ